MRGIVLFSLMAVGFVLFAGAAIGLSYAKYDEVTTVVTIEDGITCTINDRAVSNGEKVTFKNGEDLKIHIESEYALPISMAGRWTSDTKTVTDYRIDGNDMTVRFGHGIFDGKLKVAFTKDDGDIAAVVLKFTIGSGITAKCGTNEIKDGDTYTFHGDNTVTVTTNDGARHDVKYNGSWSNEYGMSGGASGQELGSSVNISIVDMMYFSDGHGTMEIHI